MHELKPNLSILSLSTAGPSSMDGRRMRQLCDGLEADIVYHDVDRKGSRLSAFRAVQKLLRSRHWDLVYLEGTGVVGGVPLILASWRTGQRFVVSSGDPIGGFFEITKGKIVGSIFEIYEQLLYRASVGFIGWTPYLTGVALKLGAPRAITVEGGVNLRTFRSASRQDRTEVRRRLGLDTDHLVCGVVGSLAWTARHSYCYGLELIETMKRMKRTDVSALIVGDGNGRARLEALVPLHLRKRVVFTGRLSEEDVISAINAMDVGFVAQSLDSLGNFRLTTKLPEYLACGVPVAMSPIPGFYDYARTAGWALPAFHPASAKFHDKCAAWLDSLEWSEVEEKAQRARSVAEDRFDSVVLCHRFTAFIHSLAREE